MARDHTDGSFRMERLGALPNYTVSEDSPDIRGWTVESIEGQALGTVSDLLIDTDAMKARYLLVDRDEGLAGAGGEVAIPAESTDVREWSRRVIAQLHTDQMASLKPFTGTLPADYGASFRDEPPRQEAVRAEARHEEPRREEFRREELRREKLRRDEPRRAEPRREETPGEVHVTRSAEELMVNKREVPAGEVRVRKHVETEHVERPVTSYHEEVDVRRERVTGRVAAPTLGDEEIRIPLSREEVFVEKQPVVQEEIIVSKRRVADEEHVEADLRREEVEILGLDEARERYRQEETREPRPRHE